ncbi:uncharacterized protein LOC144008931 [Festucalex cinctus]
MQGPSESSENLVTSGQEGPEALQQSVHGQPHIQTRLFLHGQGIGNWHHERREAINCLNPSIPPDKLGGLIEDTIQDKGIFYAELTGQGYLLTAVVKHPSVGQTKEKGEIWLKWWVEIFSEYNVVQLVSTQPEFDPVVKMLAATAQIEGKLIKPSETRAMPRLKEYQPLLDQITEIAVYRKQGNILESGSEIDSDYELTPEGITMEDTDTEYDNKESEWQAREEVRHKALTQKMSPLRLQPPLISLPDETTKKVNVGNGIMLCQFHGNVWEIGGSALIVLTDVKLRPYNSKFRASLKSSAGIEFERERRDIRSQAPIEEVSEAREYRITSGGSSNFYMIVHCPGQKWTPELNQRVYMKNVMKLLERAINGAIDQEATRVVIDVNGIRSGRMLWTIAESVALGAFRLQIATPVTQLPDTEFVVAISQEQHNRREAEAMERWTARALQEARLQLKEEAQRQKRRLMKSPEGAGSPATEQGMSTQNVTFGPHPSSVTGSLVSVAKEMVSDDEQLGPSGLPTTPWRPSLPGEGREKLTEIKKSPGRNSMQDAVIDPGLAASSPQGVDDSYRELPPPTPVTKEVMGRKALKKTNRDAELMAPPISSSSGEEEESEDERDDLGSLESFAPPTSPNHAQQPKVIKGAIRKGTKKQQPVLSVLKASERIALDTRVGYLQTKDDRRVYVPSVGQTEYPYPAAWLDKLSEEASLTVKTSYGEIINVLMTPAYRTLINCTMLTKNFREGFVTVLYDVLLKLVKQAAYCKAQTELREQDDVINQDGAGVGPAGAQAGSATSSLPVSVTVPQQQQNTAQPVLVTQAPNDLAMLDDQERNMRAFKALKAMVRDKDPKETVKEYLYATSHLGRKWL